MEYFTFTNVYPQFKQMPEFRERKIAREILNPLTLRGHCTEGRFSFLEGVGVGVWGGVGPKGGRRSRAEG
jgi:hypothetical protein